MKNLLNFKKLLILFTALMLITSAFGMKRAREYEICNLEVTNSDLIDINETEEQEIIHELKFILASEDIKISFSIDDRDQFLKNINSILNITKLTKFMFRESLLDIALRKKATIQCIIYLIEMFKKNFGFDSSIINNGLHYACKYYPQAIEILLNYDANTEIDSDFELAKPLHLAAQLQPGAIEILLKYGANIEAEDFYGRTPLHIASMFNTKSTKILLKNGANLEATDRNKLTPLHYAAHYPEALEILLKHGADINAKDYSQRDILIIALKDLPNNKSIRLLLKHPNIIAGYSSLIWTALGLNPHTLNKTLYQRITASYNLVERGLDLADCMLWHGSFYEDGLSKLNLKLYQKIRTIDKLFKLVKSLNSKLTEENLYTIKKLVKTHINLNIMNLENKRLIDYAAEKCNLKLIALLLSLNAAFDKVIVEKLIGHSPYLLITLAPELDPEAKYKTFLPAQSSKGNYKVDEIKSAVEDKQK